MCWHAVGMGRGGPPGMMPPVREHLLPRLQLAFGLGALLTLLLRRVWGHRRAWVRRRACVRRGCRPDTQATKKKTVKKTPAKKKTTKKKKAAPKK